MVKRSNIADTELDLHINKEFMIRIDKFLGDSFNSWVKFHVDDNGNVTHLTVHDPRLMHHKFDRVQCCFIQMLYVIDYRRCRI